MVHWDDETASYEAQPRWVDHLEAEYSLWETSG